MTITAGTALGIVELVDELELYLLMARHHHLGDALAVVDDKVGIREVDEQHH